MAPLMIFRRPLSPPPPVGATKSDIQLEVGLNHFVIYTNETAFISSTDQLMGSSHKYL